MGFLRVVVEAFLVFLLMSNVRSQFSMDSEVIDDNDIENDVDGAQGEASLYKDEAVTFPFLGNFTEHVLPEPYINEIFKDSTEKMALKMDKSDKQAANDFIKKLLVITGNKSVGKNENVQDFATYFFTRYGGNVFWINCKTEKSMTADFKQIGVKMGLSAKEDFETIYKILFEYFNKQDTLFVFYNARSERQFLNKLNHYLKSYDDLNVILTSIDENWNKLAFNTVNLDALSEYEAVEYMGNYLMNMKDPSIKFKNQVREDEEKAV